MSVCQTPPPTQFCYPGQVQSKKCIEEVLHFAYEENLFVMADEVTSTSTQNFVRCVEKEPAPGISVYMSRQHNFTSANQAYAQCNCGVAMKPLSLEPGRAQASFQVQGHLRLNQRTISLSD